MANTAAPVGKLTGITVAQTSALRRAQEPQQPRSTILTPQEFSQKKYEKDMFVMEQMRQYRLQVLQNQKVGC